MGKYIFHDGFINNILNNTIGNTNFVKYIDMVIIDKATLNIDELNVSNIKIDNAVFLITDYVDNISMKKFIEVSNRNDFYIILCQIVFCLYTSFKKIEFVHFDLHIGNIIIEKKENTSISYDDITLKTNFIAKIYDYEYSHVVFKGTHIGVDIHEINVYNKNFWIHDIFKLFMSIYDIVLKKRKDYRPAVEKILSFFTKKMNEKIYLKFQNTNYYLNLRYFDHTMNYDDFIFFFVKQILEPIKNNVILKNDILDIKNYMCD
jgi:hypothetical protein